MISIKCRDKLLFSGINWKSNYKSLSTFEKVVGVGKVHNYFPHFFVMSDLFYGFCWNDRTQFKIKS